MKLFLLLLPCFLLSACVTETSYSSHMYGNNQETITVGKKNKVESSNGSSLMNNNSITK